MSERRKIVLVVLVAGIMAALSGGAVAAAQGGDQMPQKSEKRSSIIAGEPAARQMLRLMDKNEDGKVSKEEWMRFMEAEFDRLDTNHDGFIDVKDMEKSRIQPAPFSRVGK